jgi:hypothetical protein
MDFEIILDKGIKLVTEIDNIILALSTLGIWWKGRRENRQLTEVMNQSEVKNDEFKILAMRGGLKSALKVLKKLLP